MEENNITIEDFGFKNDEYFKDDFTQYKIVIAGLSGVGKTSLIQSAKGEKFSDKIVETFGFESSILGAKVNGIQFKLIICDIGGKYLDIKKALFYDGSLAILVYDITKEDSFESVKVLQGYLDGISRENIILVGNKLDLDNQRKVLKDKIYEKYGSDETIKAIIECSAKTGIQVKEVFEKAIEILYKKSIEDEREKKEYEEEEANDEEIVYDSDKDEDKCCSCSHCRCHRCCHSCFLF